MSECLKSVIIWLCESDLIIVAGEWLVRSGNHTKHVSPLSVISTTLHPALLTRHQHQQHHEQDQAADGHGDDTVCARWGCGYQLFNLK